MAIPKGCHPGCGYYSDSCFYAHGRIIPVQRWRPLPPRPSEGAAVDPEAVIRIYRSALTKIAAKRWQADATRCHPKAGCESPEIARRALDKARLLGGGASNQVASRAHAGAARGSTKAQARAARSAKGKRRGRA